MSLIAFVCTILLSLTSGLSILKLTNLLACSDYWFQVALGETEKRSVGIPVSAKIGDQKGVIGTLSAENHPHIPCDLIFEKQFELSHSSKTASVFACGYKIPKHNSTPDSP